MGSDWYRDAIFYELSTRTFADGNGDGIGDFAGLEARLDYLRWLGVDVLWLLPIFPSPLRDDGYDVADYYGVHPHFGTMEDFRSLVEAAHRRDLRILIELIPNHTSNRHPWFQASRDPAHPLHAKYRDWYVWSETDEKYAGTRIIFLDTEASNWTYDPLRGAYYWHRFYRHQPDLNYDNPEVQREMLRVAQFWLDQGVDGFRVDAVPYLYEREGTSCESLPETHAYLKRLRAFVEAYAPGTLLLAEANQWPADLLPYFGEGDEFQMGFHFPLMTRIFMALAKGSRAPIEWVVEFTPPLPDGCQWATFLRNHDELTLEMVTEEERRFMWDFYAPEPRMRFNLGIRRRLAPLLGNDRRRIELAHSMLLTLIGSPVLYYGDEIGMGDNIWLDDRNGVRTPMQWDDGPNGGFSSAPKERLFLPVIEDEVYGYPRVNVAAQRAQPDSLLNRLRHLLHVRRGWRSFGRGELTLFPVEEEAVLLYTRTWGEERALVCENLSPRRVDFTPPPALRGRWDDLLAGGEATVGERMTLEPYGYRWLGRR